MLVELSVVEQRYAAVLEVTRDGLSVAEVAERHGVSRQSVYTWIANYEAGGLAGPVDRSHRPASCPHQISSDLEAAICELRRLHPGWGQRRIAHELARVRDDVASESAIYRALARNGLLIPGARRRKKSDYRRWERARPMELWQMDVMGGVRLADGSELKVLTGLDDHSRFCVAAGLMRTANARSVCRVFAAALRHHGLPDEILTDNGKVFTGRFPSPRSRCSSSASAARTASPIASPRFAHQRRPARSVSIERFHKSLRLELLAGMTFTDLDEAQSSFDAWVLDYNTARPHQGIGMATPSERFATRRDEVEPAAQPSPGPAPTEVTRHVTVSGNISVTGQTFNVGRRYAGRTVTVDVGRSVLRVFFDGALVKSLPRRNSKPIVQYEAHTRYRNASA